MAIKFALIRVNDDDPEDVTVLESWFFKEKLETNAPLFRKRYVRKAFEKMEQEGREFSVRV